MDRRREGEKERAGQEFVGASEVASVLDDGYSK